MRRYVARSPRYTKVLAGLSVVFMLVLMPGASAQKEKEGEFRVNDGEAREMLKVLVKGGSDSAKGQGLRHSKFRSRQEVVRLSGVTEPLPIVTSPAPAPPRPFEDPDRLKSLSRNQPDPDLVRTSIERMLSQRKDSLRTRAAEDRSGPSLESPAGGPLFVEQEWRQIGAGIFESDNVHHKSGRATQVTYAYDHSQRLTTLWVGTSSGGLWKVVVAGFFPIFVPVSDTLPGSPSVGAFVVHPNDSNKILIATGDPWRYSGTGMYKTTNGGRTWRRVTLNPAPEGFQAMWIDRSNPNVVLASGDTWSRSGVKGIWRSENFGETWRRVYSGAASDVLQDPVYHSYWYAGAPGIGVLESRDGGRVFHPITREGGRGIPDPVGRVSLAVSEAAPNYVYAVIESPGDVSALNGIYRSSNYGTDWVPLDTGDSISWGQAFHTTAIGVDPSDPDRLFVGMGGLQYTENATSNSVCWVRGRGEGCEGCSTRCVDGGHADYTSFAFVAGQTSVILANDGGIYSYDYRANSTNGLANLLGLNAEQIAYEASPTDQPWADEIPDVQLSGLQDNGMVRTRPAESSPNKFLGGGDGGHAAIGPASSQDFFFSSGVAYNRYFSTNAGDDWNNVNCAFGNEWAAAVIPDAAGATADMYTHARDTRDNRDYIWWKPASPGCDWRRMNSTPLPAGWLTKRIQMANSYGRLTFYLMAWSDPRLLVMDGGEYGTMTWVDRTPPALRAVPGIDGHVHADKSWLAPETVYYTTGVDRPSRAFVSHDRGLHWRNATGNVRTLVPAASFWELIAVPTYPGPPQEFFLATSVGVFRSNDGGRVWSPYMEGLPAVVDVRAIEILRTADGMELRLATYGRGWWGRKLDPAR